MKIISQSSAGKESIENHDSALIGLSIRNSYFKEDNLKELIKWADENFANVFIMIPDIPAVDTLKSLGYNENRARQKAQLASNNLENKCISIIEEFGIEDKSKIIRWEDVINNPEYTSSYKKLCDLYELDQNFKQDVRDSTNAVIEFHGSDLPSEKAINIGVGFLLKELAFISESAKILGVKKCAYIYHRPMSVYENLISGKYNIKTHENSGYIICEI
ncbi:MAG: tRNA-dependent cyclodipeptide synthase [Patescibacteria group bacterium]|nr:tRNA-dependent cyclodipeptide synthase [Patescibacteria group bacterium]